VGQPAILPIFNAGIEGPAPFAQVEVEEDAEELWDEADEDFPEDDPDDAVEPWADDIDQF